jgi:ATP-binding cassette subfamily F protein uup
VRALEELREIRAERVKRPRAARVQINEAADVSGRKVIEVRNVTHGYGGRTLLKDFSLRVMRGDRLGIIGNNGVGKSTLLRILLGELAPDSGSVKLGTNLEIAYFDQLRRELDTTKTVAETVGEGREYVTIQGHQKHVVSYLTDFLFPAKRAATPIAALSGGERNRVILAKLFTRAANLLVLDEPTNDLDVETLEALEDRLAEFDGTLLVVSHDRYFLDAIVTSTLVFEEDGRIVRHAGGYSDWLARRRALAVDEQPTKVTPQIGRDTREKPAQRKLSYKLQRELDSLPEQIERLEQRVAELRAIVTAPTFYQGPHGEVQTSLDELRAAEQELEDAVDRWAELEQQAAAAASGDSS